jgi:DNA polymerase
MRRRKGLLNSTVPHERKRMADQPQPTQIDLALQLRQHLESLRAAGVEWLPVTGAAPAAPPADAGAAPAVVAPSLFDAASLHHPQEAAMAPEQRRQELEVLSARVAECTRCKGLCSTRTQTVFGVGPVDPDLCLVGEAPGATEDARGEPFVGDAGQLLNRIIAACGLKREDIYICNILKCRPPNNRQPRADEAANCREFLEKQLELVRPKFLCALGGTAAKYLLNTETTIGRLRGRFYEFCGIPVMCTYHPSYLLRLEEPEKTKKKKDVWEDMKKLLARMGRPVPQK